MDNDSEFVQRIDTTLLNQQRPSDDLFSALESYVNKTPLSPEALQEGLRNLELADAFYGAGRMTRWERNDFRDILEKAYGLPHRLTTFEKITVGVNASVLLAFAGAVGLVFYQPVIKPAFQYLENLFR